LALDYRSKGQAGGQLAVGQFRVHPFEIVEDQPVFVGREPGPGFFRDLRGVLGSDGLNEEIALLFRGGKHRATRH
jgi:hypothetical protein